MYKVNHAKFGLGTAEFDGHNLVITFENEDKKFSPEWVLNNFDKVITESDTEFRSVLEDVVFAILSERSEEEKAKREQKEAEELQKKLELLDRIAERNRNIAHRVNKSIDPEFCKLFYAGATDVSVESDNDLYFILGFIAGHADKISAQMTWDRVEDFHSIFPDADYHEVHRKDADATDCCFRVMFPKTISVPDLMESMLVQNISGYQLAKSAFVFRLVHDYGLLFGDDVADVAYIRELAKATGCDEDFVKGYFF